MGDDGLTVWRKSTRSSTGNCVEIRQLLDEVLIRDSKDPDGTVLSFGTSSFRSFVAGLRAGDFDRR